MATTSGPAPLRATDADRAAVLDALDTAHDSGHLDRVEHYERVRAATAARHLDDLRPLVADLQGKVRLPAGRTPARRTNTSSSSPHRTTPLSAEQIRDIEVPTQWSTRKSVGVAAVVLAGALGLFLALAPLSDDTRPIDDPGESVIARPAPAGDEGTGGDDGEARVFDTPSALSAEGLTRIRDTAPDAAGSEVATDLVVYPEYAVLTWPDVEHPSREFRMTYRGGWDDRDDSPASPLPDPTFRIADIDPALVASVVRGAPETLGIPDPTSTYVIIDADEQGLPQYRVYVSNDVHLSGYLLVDHTGEPKSIHAP